MSFEAREMPLRSRPGEHAHRPWWLRTVPRRLLLVTLALVPFLTPVVSPRDDAPFVYPYCAATLLLSGWFCWQASRLYPEQKLRWQTVALALCVHAVSYFIAGVEALGWVPYARGAWYANACVSVSWVLFLPALLGVRAVRGRWVRGLDYAMAAVTAALMMLAMGSGPLPGEGFSRVIVVMMVVVFLSAAACVVWAASSRPGIRLFSAVISAYLATCVVSYFLLNIVNLYWVKQPYTLASDVVISLPELLLCEWAVGWKLRPVERSGGLTPAQVDSLQPSLMALAGVLLALYGFRAHTVLAGCSVVLIVVCYALRTQLFYHLLFTQQTELQTQATEMEQLATRDPLTGVGNRRWFDEEVQKLLAAGRTYPCSLVLVDTDKFKEINDGFGHPVGDLVLRSVATALTELTVHVKRGCCARIGGDEFGALWPGVNAAEALELAEMLRVKVEGLDLQVPLRITVSLGIATTQEPAPLIRLMRWADSALYRAKAAGRNTVRGIDLGTLREEDSQTEDPGGLWG